jgi:hypothetical protein
MYLKENDEDICNFPYKCGWLFLKSVTWRI